MPPILSEGQRLELDRRLADSIARPDAVTSWEEVKAQLGVEKVSVTKPTIDELRLRLLECARYYGGTIALEAALVWDGYLAALIEWGLISVADHAEFLTFLPPLPNRPTLGVFLGFEHPIPGYDTEQ